MRTGGYKMSIPRTLSSRRGRSLGGQGFPKKLRIVHKYTDRDLGVFTTLKNYNFSCNGMYDPNIGGVGSQPYYFDQLAALYNHYVVIGSKIKVTLVSDGTTAQQPYRAVLWINDDSSAPLSFDAAWNTSGAVTRFAQGGVNPDRIIMKKSWSAKKTFGGNIMNNSLMRGNASGNPTEQSHYQLNLIPMDGVSSCSVWSFIEISYIAVWSELKDIAIS